MFTNNMRRSRWVRPPFSRRIRFSRKTLFVLLLGEAIIRTNFQLYFWEILHTRESLRYEDWRLSRIDRVRQDPSQRAKTPTSETDCTECASFLAGSVSQKRFLLVGHSVKIGGGEIWLRDLGEMLESSGAIVRFLFLQQRRPSLMLDSHDEKGLSYLFFEKDRHNVDFSDFDFVIANTVAVETWHRFYESMAYYKSQEEMEKIYSKTIFAIHESTGNDNPFLLSMLPKVPKILFPSNACRAAWVKLLPQIASKSFALHPGIPKQKMLSLMNISDQKETLRKGLNIPTESVDDIVLLQVSSICPWKGVDGLLDAFKLMFDSISPDVIQERAWFLVLVGDSCSWGNYPAKIEKINSYLYQQMKSRSRIILRPSTLDVASYYRAADLFVLNSVYETFGLVFVEAMLAGKPVIGRDIGGIPEIIDDGTTGKLLPNKEGANQVELSRAIVDLTTGSDWRSKLNQMGTAGKNKASSSFSSARMARDFSNIIAELNAKSTETR